MKWIDKLIGKRRVLPHKPLELNPCKYHDQRQFPDLVETDYCRSCDMKMCYMCAHPHFDHGCHVSHTPHKGPEINPSLKGFNWGALTLLSWKDLLCSCGKPWTDGHEPTICVACGSATCSADCHLKLQEDHQCLFFTNFTAEEAVFEEVNGFRAILLHNINVAKQGQRVTYASPRFMSAFKHSESHIALQRGFRQYGTPASSTQDKMQVIEETPTYEHRLCPCQCEKCVQSPHPVYNCTSYCENSEHKKLQSIECWCICSACILKGPHARSDCLHSCKMPIIE